VAIFDDSLRSFGLLGVFTVLDSVLRRLTGRTGSIAVEMRKPAP
jgi:hypothetical protein